MNNGTSIEDLKADLDLVFEDFYQGLTRVADELRQGGSPAAIATEIEALVLDFCKHWPTCAAVHHLGPNECGTKPEAGKA